MITLWYKIFNELCPALTPWYLNHPEAFEREFYGPQGQDMHQRVFYTVADAHGVIVGTGGVIQKERERHVGELSNIYLDNLYRDKGLGKTLVKDLIGKATKMGFDKLFLTTRTEFVAATALYQKLGFTQIPNEKYRSAHSTAWELNLHP
ncbi:GNAT family N-acetyltransferase [Candidatus Woesearchaeota archaeon]|nr:GNAT family N-acetyltransferase [Candidatus Woesearchaeota archaeon]